MLKQSNLALDSEGSKFDGHGFHALPTSAESRVKCGTILTFLWFRLSCGTLLMFD